MQVKTIIEFINTYKTADRDKKVVEAINNYYRNNADALNDGIIEKYISFGNINIIFLKLIIKDSKKRI